MTTGLDKIQRCLVIDAIDSYDRLREVSRFGQELAELVLRSHRVGETGTSCSCSQCNLARWLLAAEKGST